LALVLFDIDGTLMRRAGPHHRQALEDAVHLVTRRPATIEGIPVAGALDRDILLSMMRTAGLTSAQAKAHLPAVMEKAQLLYTRRCPDLRAKVCPGVRRLLPKLVKQGAVTGLVTGNLSRIGWKKMERSGLKAFFRFGAFAEMGATRGALARLARRQAVSQGWVSRKAPACLIGDHPNDVAAARKAGVTSVAVATGVVGRAELEAAQPDYLIDDLRSFDTRWIFE
jgi:phosphoglycolate phosphatase-like HAD superfamily hydrolase